MRIPISHKLVILADIITAKKKPFQKITESPKFDEGALRRHFNLKKDEKITMEMLNSAINKLEKKYPEGGYSKEDLKLKRRLEFAQTLMSHS